MVSATETSLGVGDLPGAHRWGRQLAEHPLLAEVGHQAVRWLLVADAFGGDVAEVLAGGARFLDAWQRNGRQPSPGDLGDVAVLRLQAPIAGTRPVWLAEADDPVWGHPARTFGFPAGRPEGVWHTGVLRWPQAGGRLQFERAPAGAYEVSPGFSGATVWDEELAAVVGMVVAADTGRPAASLIPVGRAGPGITAAAASARPALPVPRPVPV